MGEMGAMSMEPRSASDQRSGSRSASKPPACRHLSPARASLLVVAHALAFALSGAAAGCGGSVQVPPDPGLEDLAVTEVGPAKVLPGSTLRIRGRSFVPSGEGQTELRLTGVFWQSGGDVNQVDYLAAPEYVSSSELRLAIDEEIYAGMRGYDGTFVGDLQLSVVSAVDGRRYQAPLLEVQLGLARQLTPRVDSVSDVEVYLDDAIEVAGDDFLLGGGEGDARVRLSGCFEQDDLPGRCPGDGISVDGVELHTHPPAAAATDRRRLSFLFSPAIAGLRPGRFSGQLTVVNVHSDGEGNSESLESEPLSVYFKLLPPELSGIRPQEVSLGQYLEVDGAGLAIGEDEGSDVLTKLALRGTLTRDGEGPPSEVAVDLIPEVATSRHARYVLNEADALGRLIDLRSEAGSFRGTMQAVVRRLTMRDAHDEVRSPEAAVEFRIGYVRQVVYIRFLPSYVESLRQFGLRALDDVIRRRVFAVANRDYTGINIEFRSEQPEDYALYSTVEVGGPDPNNRGFLGYDNTPGKDCGNLRLFDRIGGVNAITQQDGAAGYGGIFTESLFGFSKHPPEEVKEMGISSPLFDEIFDHVRPDVGGTPVTAEELAAVQPPELEDGSGCPARDRGSRIACAAWALGSLIGTTMTHEIGHSLGLADPEGTMFHDPGDLPIRLMESGGDRPFDERSEVKGIAAAVFCSDPSGSNGYEYLRRILPGSPVPPPEIWRPECY